MKHCLLLVLILTTVGCDRLTKHMAAVTLDGTPPRVYLGTSVRLEYAENPGAFLSLGADLPPRIRTGLFTLGTGALLVLMAAMGWRRRQQTFALFGIGIALAGGSSNLFDRVAQGGVIDFVSVGIGPLRTGIFNVADLAVLLGLILFLAANSACPPESKAVSFREPS